MFFVKGDYSYQSRDRAMNDYVTTIKLAKSSDDPHYSQWANAVSDVVFTSLNTYYSYEITQILYKK
jgi:hypothetical protein